MERVIKQSGQYRIVEVLDEYFRIGDLKGDCFNPEVNPDIDPEQLVMEEIAFTRRVMNEGVYGYVLEKWYPEIGHGWDSVDSCWGFVGQYDEKTNDHYIVNELMQQTQNKAV